MGETVFAATLAGVAGAGAGGLATLCRRNAWPMGPALGFAAGTMLGMAFFDLLPEALIQGDFWLALLGLALGGLLAAAAEWAEARRSRWGGKDARPGATGLLLLAALALHNLPEGFAVGAAGPERLWLRAGLIALHNLPAGMAAALSLTQGGWPRWRAVLAASVSGLPLAAGAALGAALGGAPAEVLSLSLAAAAGAVAFAAAFSLAQPPQKGGRWLAAGLALAWLLTSVH